MNFNMWNVGRYVNVLLIVILSIHSVVINAYLYIFYQTPLGSGFPPVLYQLVGVDSAMGDHKVR